MSSLLQEISPVGVFLKIHHHTFFILDFYWCIVDLPGGRAWQPTRYPCLENPMNRGAWHATVHRVAESDTTE